MAVSPPKSAVALDTTVGNAADDLFEQGRIILGHRHVIEKEERFGAAAQGVIDAHRHQVDSHGVVDAHQGGHLELGAHAVRTGDEHGILVTAGEQRAHEIKLEEAGKALVEFYHPGGVCPR